MLETCTLASSGIWSRTLSIPAAATAAGGNILTALRAAGYAGPANCAIEICGVVVAGTDRGAVLLGAPASEGAAVIAADLDTHGRLIKAGIAYVSTNLAEPALCSWRAASGGAVDAVVTVQW